MLWAQIALLVLIFLGLLLFARDHGKPRKGVDSFWTALVSNALLFALIYFAGGFSRLFH